MGSPGSAASDVVRDRASSPLRRIGRPLLTSCRECLPALPETWPHARGASAYAAGCSRVSPDWCSCGSTSERDVIPPRSSRAQRRPFCPRAPSRCAMRSGRRPGVRQAISPALLLRGSLAWRQARRSCGVPWTAQDSSRGLIGILLHVSPRWSSGARSVAGQSSARQSETLDRGGAKSTDGRELSLRFGERGRASCPPCRT
jgi:hypothetical protein